MSILRDVQEDANFIAFFAKYEQLREHSKDQEILAEIKPERDQGNCEYKLKLVDFTLDRVDHLTTQMIFRLNEGFGHAVYKVGVEDNGVVLGISHDAMLQTLSVLFYMARNLNGNIVVEKVRRG